MDSGIAKDLVIALIGAVSGGIGVAFVNTFFLSKSKKEDIATIIRDELRADIKEYKDKVDKLQEDLDYWKSRYFSLIETLIQKNIPIPEDHKIYERIQE